jgi:glycosyltransferase involved in cell wall biosynthesis
MISQEYPPFLQGGLATHVQELSRGLVTKGHVVHVFSYSMGETCTEDDEGVNVHFLCFPVQGRQHQYDMDIREMGMLTQILAEYAIGILKESAIPDIVHAHEWIGYQCAEYIKVAFNCPILLTIHMVWAKVLKTLMPHPDADQMIALEGDSCRKADMLIAVSESERGILMAHYGLETRRLNVIYNGFDAKVFSSNAPNIDEVIAERSSLGLENQKLIVFAGRLSRQKGVSALLRSAMQISSLRGDVRYVIAGKLEPGGYSDLLVKMAQGHPKLRNNIMFVDKVSRQRLVNLYSLATAVVVPSLYEPFGYAATEAMAAGKAVIASETGGLSEIIQDEISGLLVPLVPIGINGEYDVDVPSLVNAQVRLLDESDTAKRLGEAAQARVRASFGWERMIDGYLAAYNNLIGLP